MTKQSSQDQAERYWQRALKAEEQKNLPEAIRLIEKAINLCPSHTVYWSAKSQFLYDSSNFEGALLAANKSIDCNPKNHHAWTIFGLAHVHVRTLEEAAACFKRSTELKEDFATYTMLAAAEVEFDVESAIKHAKKALDLNPDWDEATKILRSAESKLRAEL